MSDTSNDLTGNMSTTASSTLDRAIAAATNALLAGQRPDGHWVFELEADATIPAEYVLLRHYLGEPIDAALEAKIAVYLRRIQGAHGGWPLFHEGGLDVSATVKAYFALKMIGDSVDADHMRRAREAVRARGGAERANVFTRIMLALHGFIPWRAVPVMPVEIMLLPKWFPFHLDKISYWSRTVIVPLLVLMAKRPIARNTWSTPRKNQNHDAFCCGAFGFGPRFAGESRKSSSIRTPFALRATGRFAISNRSGTMTVRLQY